MKYKITCKCKLGHETDFTISESMKMYIEHDATTPIEIRKCPYHHYRFDPTGRNCGLPLKVYKGMKIKKVEE